MKVMAKDLKPGQIINIEYGNHNNFVKFRVEDVTVRDITVVHADSRVGKECIAFSNKEYVEVDE